MNRHEPQKLIGKTVEIIDLKDDPEAARYIGRTGVIKDIGKDFEGNNMYWGTWGGVALFDDEFIVLD